MEKDTTKKLSFPDSVKLLAELEKKEKSIRQIAYEAFNNVEALAVEAVNECLIENAKKFNVSLYDLCFHTVPVAHEPMFDFEAFEKNGEVRSKQLIELIPVEFDLTHDGGYWKNKYFELKKQMRELIDKKEE